MDKEVFQPVRGLEASILSQVHRSGYLYFATDTKRIFYDDGVNFLPMGGNSGVWYGNMEYSETPEEGQVYFTFVPDQIEGNEDVEDGNYSLPNVNDLIFNMPDGCFYKVTEVDKESESPLITGLKLTVSGGGGSGGGGGGQAGVGTMTVSRLGSSILNTLQGNSCYIRYRYTAKDASGEETGSGITELRVGGITKGTYVAQQGDNEIDVGPFLEIGKNNIQIVVTGNIGGTSSAPPQTKNWTVYSTNLSFTWNYNETTINRADDIILNWHVSTSLPHSMHIVVDDLQTIDIEFTDASQDKTYVLNRASYGLSHGSHKITLYATAEIGGETFYSASISHQVICVDENRGDTIISVSLNQNEVNQYDTLSIPIVLYDPTSANGKVSATLREDGVDKDSWIDYENGVQYYWNYTPVETGTKVLSILSGTTEKVIRLLVNDLGLSAIEVPGYEFKFKASDIISNNALQHWSYGSIVPSFSEDFDWINGGVKSEADENGNVRNYISIKAGSRMTFNYAPFEDEKKSEGFCFKIIFKANECRSYDANILNIGSVDNDNVYLTLTANEGIFKPNGSDAIRVPYCEDSYMELEFDIWPWGSGKEPYILTWLDGVPAGVTTYDSSTTFFQNPPRNIIIGSDDCDVQLYMIKVYQKHLTNEQHLTNFIMDAPNATEIVARYNRNNILDDNGEISYSKLIEKNPNCDVYLYEIPRMTVTKKDKVKGCTYKRYKGSTSPLQTAENVTMAVQGTSSAAYGLAAFNFNSTFEDGFTDYSTDPNGIHIDDWAMSEGAIPIHDFNTKVNVASCECVNNALNQEWYDRFVSQVFETEYKKKRPNSRHTMQFMNMGVVFMKDSNPVTNSEGGVGDNLFKDTPGYINNPYYKLYSACNMGNIKRNNEVFADPDNPYDVIMENPDNQSVYQQMTGVLTADGQSLRGIWEGDKFFPIDENGTKAETEVFEWRTLPEDTWDEIKTTRGVDMRSEAENAWTSLVAWFARNNPEAATGEELAEPETYAGYTFKGYTSRADRIDKDGNTMPAYTPKNQVLKGLSISKFAGTYTHDTRERRLAKMLQECEDHLIMDEIVFHYLFIERHALIDNVAKNTFWHTEDLQHWSMIKDYDNDTSDGNDNSGHLTLTYGYEVLDHVDHDPTKSTVFNAASSVWLHFIDELIEARTTMYQFLDKSEIAAWDAEPYLKIFNEWQSSLPERVWIEDYYRKYLRPKEIYGATQFLAMLEGGKKTHQRKQFETYQEAYMASEYFGRKCQTSQIDIRANGKNIDTMRFPMKMYADCYIRIAAGSGHDPNVRERYRRGDIANIQLPVTGDANDMTTYFYLAHYVTALENIEQLKPKKVDISSAYRLKEFSMKRNTSTSQYVKLKAEDVFDPSATYYERIVYNPGAEDETVEYHVVTNPVAANKLTYYIEQISDKNLNLDSVSFSNNRMLEKLEVLDCPNANNPLDLSSCTSLKYLDIRGSGFNSITIASNAPAHTLYLNDPQILSLTNLTKVNNFIMGYSKLNTLFINNIDNSPSLNSKTLVDRQSNGSMTYNLQNVQWRITDNNEVSDTGIAILDKILTPGNTPYENMHTIDKAYALSGTLTIASSAYSGDHSLDLYNKYAIESTSNFPNLDIIFEDDAAKLYTVEIVDGNNNVIWSKKTDKNYTITGEFLSSGPMGAFNLTKAITKENTVANTFTFSDRWEIRDATTDTLISTVNRAGQEDKNPYYSTQLNTNIVIIPVFNSAVRRYHVQFLNSDQVITSGDYNYGVTIKSIIPSELPNKDDTALPREKTYAFLGYSLVPTAKNALVFSDDYVVNADLTYYAIFTDEIDVHNSKNVHNEFFTFTPANYNTDPDSSYNLSGYDIRPKNGVVLKGKVTIPAMYNDRPIVSISGFGINTGDTNQRSITGVFFETGTQIRKIEDSAFYGLNNLIYLDMPDCLRHIGRAGLQGTRLKLGATKDDNTYYFGKNIVRVDATGLIDCLNIECEFLYIGSKIKQLNAGGQISIGNFNAAINLKGVYFGTSEEPVELDFNSIEANNSIVFVLNAIDKQSLQAVTYYVRTDAIVSQIMSSSTLQDSLMKINGTGISPTLTVLSTGGI